jgi:hypothetical protein
MTATVFTHDGIVISTFKSDTFYQVSKRSDEDYIERISVSGHPHVITFWGRYALVFHQADEFSYNSDIIPMFEDVMRRWPDEIPTIYELMPYIKKQIVDNSLQIIGIMGGYSRTPRGYIEPYVYQILGDDLRRININNNGDITYNCVFLEKETVVGRLLRDVQVKNGKNWENLPPVQLRCDLYSIDKAEEITKFILNTSNFILNINQSLYQYDEIETVVITSSKLIIR